jgi:hypothetical protein
MPPPCSRPRLPSWMTTCDKSSVARWTDQWVLVRHTVHIGLAKSWTAKVGKAQAVCE